MAKAPLVDGEPSPFFERVDQRRRELGVTSDRALSLALGLGPDFIRDLKRRGHLPKSENLETMAEYLATTTDWLLGRADDPRQVHSEVGLAERRLGWNAAPQPGGRLSGRADPPIPVVGTGDCATLSVHDEQGHLLAVERSSFDPDFHVRYITRPPALSGAKDVYAIYFHGSSMEPRFFAGEVGLVDPRRPAGPGDYVVVQLRDDESDDVSSVLVKRLVRQSATDLHLEQHNPAVIFTLPRSQVVRLHRIIPQTDLLF